MTKEQVENLNLGIAPVDAQTILMVESAFEWINTNTILNIAYNDESVLAKVSSAVKLFVIKYFDLMSMRPGITSESLGGMSQSFDTNNKSELLWQYAYELLGDSLKSQMSFVSAKSRWC